MAERLKLGLEFLAEKGLNLAAVFDCAALPEEVVGVMGVPVAGYKRLLLLGHGGRRFWRALNEFGRRTADPVDHFSIHLAESFLRHYLDNPPHLRLYPLTEYAVPLQRLGELAGWCQPSPLGLGISPIYGLWFAYRAAFLVAADLPLITSNPAISPCDSCNDKPCIMTCPPGAVRLEAGFEVFTCSHYRLEATSPCQDRCLARLACPVAPEHRYTLEQTQYHYGRSLQTIREYFG